jgi:hypothetical protein
MVAPGVIDVVENTPCWAYEVAFISYDENEAIPVCGEGKRLVVLVDVVMES